MLSLIRYLSYLILVSVIATEILFRIFDPIGISYIYEIKRYFKRTVPHEVFAYHHEPNLQDTFQGIQTSFNSHGFRGPEFSPAKPADTSRIMILGDSVVYGWGVRYESTFPALLQDAYDASNESIEVIPAGVCSWNTRTEYEFFREIGSTYQPDLLVLVVVFNDIEPKKEGRTEVDKQVLFPKADRPKSFLTNMQEDVRRFAVKHSYLFAYIRYFWTEYFKAGGGGGPGLSTESPQWTDARLALDGLIRLSEEQGISLVVYLWASESELETNPILKLYANHLKTRGITTLTAPDAVRNDPAYRISFVDGHPNPEGHKLIAQKMRNDLRTMLPARDINQVEQP